MSHVWRHGSHMEKLLPHAFAMIPFRACFVMVFTSSISEDEEIESFNASVKKETDHTHKQDVLLLGMGL